MVLVVVTYEAAGTIERFLSSLPAALTGVESARVVVVDNDSQDGTAALVDRLAPWVDLHRSRVNAGYAAGINVALMNHAAARATVVLNPDAVPSEGFVAALLRAAEVPGAGIAVPRVNGDDGRLKFSLRREPTLLRAVGEALLGGHRAARWPQLGDMIRNPGYYVDGATADWATGAAMLLTTQVVKDVGLWDESFFLYSEETDYALRARDAGYSIRWCGDAVVTHPGGQMSKSPFLWSLVARNRVRLYAKRHGKVESAMYWLVVFLNELSRAAMGRPTHRAALRALLRPASSGRRR